MTFNFIYVHKFFFQDLIDDWYSLLFLFVGRESNRGPSYLQSIVLPT